jgi:hypothetical protein
MEIRGGHMSDIKCSQCGKPAIGLVAEQPLCVDCYFKFQQANQMYNAGIYSYMNFLLSQMESAVGIYGITPKIEIPKSIIHQGPINLHNIRVDKSNIGVINTGDIGRIEIARNVINSSGDQDLSEAIREFTEAIIEDKTTNQDIKKALVEQISFLSAQAAIPKEKRQVSIAKAILKTVTGTLASLSSATTLITSWDKLVALFDKYFG